MDRGNTSNVRTMNRREFLSRSAAVGASLAVPMIVPSSVFGADAPSNRITVGSIGAEDG